MGVGHKTAMHIRHQSCFVDYKGYPFGIQTEEDFWQLK